MKDQDVTPRCCGWCPHPLQDFDADFKGADVAGQGGECGQQIDSSAHHHHADVSHMQVKGETDQPVLKGFQQPDPDGDAEEDQDVPRAAQSLQPGDDPFQEVQERRADARRDQAVQGPSGYLPQTVWMSSQDQENCQCAEEDPAGNCDQPSQKRREGQE